MDIELLALGRVSVVECLTSSASLLGHLAFDLKGHHNFFGLRGRRKAPQVVKYSFTYVRQRQLPSIGNRTAKIFLPHPIFQIPPRNPPLLPSQRGRLPLPNSPFSPRKRKALPKVQNFRAHGRKFPSARKYFSFRKEINFLAEGNFSPCGRKSRRLPKKNFPPFERKFYAVRKERNFRICENIFSYIRK